jgi:zinc protease
VRCALLALALVAACGPKAGDSKDPWKRSGIDWSKPPAAGPEPDWKPPVPATWTLENGVKVVLVENHRLPLVSVRVVNHRAGAREDGRQLGLAALTLDVIAEATTAMSSTELPEAIEQLGARLDTSIAEDASAIWIDTLATTFDGAVDVVADILQRPRFDHADIDRLREDAVDDLRLRPQEPRRVAALVFDRVILKDHPYGEPPSGTIETVSALTPQDIGEFWRAHYGPGATTIVIAGDVTRAHAEEIVREELGDWKSPAMVADETAAPPLPATPKPVVALVDRPGAPQSVVMIGRRGPAAGDPQYFADEVVNTAIGGSFASRLNLKLREELAYTYGIYSGYWRGRWAGTWSASSSLETSVTVPGLREALAILKAARDEELPATELAETQQLMTRALPQSFETNAGIAGELAALAISGLPLDWHQQYVDGVRRVTAKEARDAAAWRWADVSIVVVGDAKKLEADLQSLGLPIVRYGTDGQPAK